MIDLADDGRRLVDFARASYVEGLGFGWLDGRGRTDPDRPVHLWVTCRMVHVFSLAALQGDTDAARLARGGVRALTDGPLRDRGPGGWLSSVDLRGRPVGTAKQAYDHAFVLLAASSAVAAGTEGADDLLAQSWHTFERHFLDGAGLVIDSYPRDLGEPEPYRGANSSMHTVEALLAVAEVTGDRERRDVALTIARHVMGFAGDFGHRLPEHFDPHWTPLPDYHRDRPDDAFRPFGWTPGHSLEWARLLLQLEAAGEAPEPWLLPTARDLFEVGVRHGWAADGAPGFCYTVDWQDRPVVRRRMHWVHAEAVAAAAALHARTGGERYAEHARRWWAFVEDVLVDREGGSWHHELDADNRPTAVTWSGKPDVYHAYQATLLARLDPLRGLAAQLR